MQRKQAKAATWFASSRKDCRFLGLISCIRCVRLGLSQMTKRPYVLGMYAIGRDAEACQRASRCVAMCGGNTTPFCLEKTQMTKGLTAMRAENYSCENLWPCVTPNSRHHRSRAEWGMANAKRSLRIIREDILISPGLR